MIVTHAAQSSNDPVSQVALIRIAILGLATAVVLSGASAFPQLCRNWPR